MQQTAFRFIYTETSSSLLWIKASFQWTLIKATIKSTHNKYIYRKNYISNHVISNAWQNNAYGKEVNCIMVSACESWSAFGSQTFLSANIEKYVPGIYKILSYVLIISLSNLFAFIL